MTDLTDPSVLIGTWRFARDVEEHLLGELSHVEGKLELRQAGPDLVVWEEQGTWHRAEGDVPVRRRLRLERTGDGWWVRFEDGRDFHPWRPGEQVVHECPPDTYRGEVAGDTEGWRIVWEASGPRKDYRMITRLDRG